MDAGGQLIHPVSQAVVHWGKVVNNQPGCQQGSQADQNYQDSF
jgi:hypothetical protein